MKKVDFRQIEVENIEGQIEKTNLSKNLGNEIYMQARDIDTREFGRNIFKNGQVEISDEQELLIRRIIIGWPLVFREGIEKTLNE